MKHVFIYSEAVALSETFIPVQCESHQRCSHRYQALYNYIPHNEDELELREGDVVDVMEKCDDGWFVGKIK